MDVDLNKISFLRRDKPYNFAKIDETYEEIIQRNFVFESKKDDVVRIRSDNVIIEDKTWTGDKGQSEGLGGGDELLHTIYWKSKRGPFDFLCTVPYNCDEGFESGLEKILQMHNRPVPTGVSTTVSNCATTQLENSLDAPQTMSKIEVNQKITNNMASAEDSSLEEVQLTSSKPQLRKAIIPSAVRDTLKFSISQQREGTESLESEQLRRLHELTVWRRQIMYACAQQQQS